jgi:hypothetical protein
MRQDFPKVQKRSRRIVASSEFSSGGKPTETAELWT